MRWNYNEGRRKEKKLRRVRQDDEWGKSSPRGPVNICVCFGFALFSERISRFVRNSETHD